MYLTHFLKSNTAAAFVDIVSLTSVEETKAKLIGEVYQALQKDARYTQIRFHDITAYGYQQYSDYIINEEDYITYDVVVPPGTNKSLPSNIAKECISFVASKSYTPESLKASQDYIHLHTRTNNVRLNDTPGDILLNLQNFFADEFNTRLFFNLKFESSYNRVSNTDMFNVLFIKDAFNPSIIEALGYYYITQMSAFLKLCSDRYPSIKVIFLKEDSQEIPRELVNYLTTLELEQDLEKKIGLILQQKIVEQFEGFITDLVKLERLHIICNEVCCNSSLVESISKQALAYGDIWTASQKLGEIYVKVASELSQEFSLIFKNNFPSKEVESLCTTIIERMSNYITDDVQMFYANKGLKFFKDSRTELIGCNKLVSCIYQIKAIKENPSKAEELGLTIPNGILLVGRPGTGKTLAVEKMRDILNLPAIEFNPENYLSSGFGDTDKAVKQALSLASNLSGILFIDEIEKYLSAKGGEEHNVIQRVIAIFLKWMQSPESKNVLVVATANKPNTLSAELLRRFNYKFLFDIPDYHARKELISNKLQEHKVVSITEEDLEELVNNSEGLTGSDIHTAITNLVLEQFANDLSSNISFNALNSKLKGIALSMSNSRYKEYYNSMEFFEWCSLHYVEQAHSTYELAISL